MSTARYALLSIAVSVVILQIFASAPHANAQYIGLNIFLDKVLYTPSDKSVDIRGCVTSETSLLGAQVRIDIYGPDGELLLSNTATVNETCNFHAPIDTRTFSEYGDYLSVATYQSASDKKAFRFAADATGTNCVENDCDYFVELEGTIHQVRYRMTAGTVDSMVVDLPAKSLMVLVNSTQSNGTLTLTLPRSFVDSRQNETDTDYRLFLGSLDGGVSPVSHMEISSDENTRTIAVDYPASDEIILMTVNGTYIAPEFPAALIVLLISGAAIVAADFGLRNRALSKGSGV